MTVSGKKKCFYWMKVKTEEKGIPKAEDKEIYEEKENKQTKKK